MAEGTWDYKVPTVDTIMKRFHVELYNSATLKDRILSSKTAGEAPKLLAGSVHSALRKAILAARKQRSTWASSTLPFTKDVNDFRLDPPASMDRVKKLCGFDNVELYLAFVATK